MTATPGTASNVFAMTPAQQVAYFSKPPASGFLPPNENLLARQILLGTAIPMTIHKGKFGPYAMGQNNIQIDLDRIGAFQSVLLKVTASVDNSGSAAATASTFGPATLLKRVMYKDFQSVERVNQIGYQLWQKNTERQGRFFGLANSNPYAPSPNVGKIDTNIVNVPTAVGTSTLSFFLVVPMAVLPNIDTTGMVLAQSTEGQHSLIFDIAANAVGTDPLQAPYTAGTVAISDIYIDVYENVLNLQNGAIPWNDVNTIYALEGNLTINDNLVAGAIKDINWPNRRKVLAQSIIVNQGATGGEANGADIGRITFQLNSSLSILDYHPSAIRLLQRDSLNGDLPSGCYVISRRANPVNTQQYGQARTRLLMNTVGAGTYLMVGYETQYAAGIALPGVPQG